MRTPLKLAAFGGGVALAFGAALGVGSAVGNPIDPAPDTHDMGDTGKDEMGTDEHDMDGMGTDEHGGGEDSGADESGDEHGGDEHGGGADAPDETATELPGGLMVSERGFTLVLAQDALPAGQDAPLAFQVLGADGEPVTDYEQSHDEDLHLIAVRRDTTGFQHVHPEMDADGTWSVPLDLTAGSWRVFADFVPAGEDAAGNGLTLGADISVAGDYQPEPMPEASTTAEVDGYTVTLDGELVPDEESELTLSVARDGQPVTDLEPYLAAYGHLVALRTGDLAYLHVHPAGEPGDGSTQPGPEITFYATIPSVGDYRLFLDFQHDGVVRTAEFTARADGN